MDATISARAVTPPVITPTRADSAPVRDAVPTELPQPTQSVSPPPPSGETRQSGGQEFGPKFSDTTARAVDAERERVEREVDYESDVGDLVFKAVDSTTGQVMSQTPSEALIKLRAYVQEQAAAAAEQAQAEAPPPPEVPHVEITA